MADEENTEQVEKSNGKKKKLIIIGAALLVVVLMAVAAFLFLSGGGEEESEAEVEEVVEDTGPLETPTFLKLGTFAVMLKDGKHNFRVGLQLMMSNEPVKFYYSGRMPLVKDLLLEILPDFTAEQLKTEEGRDQMRASVIQKLHELLPEEAPGGEPRPIRKLLFDEFVVTPAY